MGPSTPTSMTEQLLTSVEDAVRGSTDASSLSTSRPGEVTSFQSLAGSVQSLTVNRTARTIVRRILSKLSGTDFCVHEDDGRDSQLGPLALQSEHALEQLSVEYQVRRLLREATSNTNLCQHYIGWCAYW